MSGLRALNLEGSSKLMANHSVVVYPECLKTLSRLQYLSLTNVELSTLPFKMEITSTDAEAGLETNETVFTDTDNALTNLTMEALEEVEILPYEIYKLQREEHEENVETPGFWDGFSHFSNLEYLHIWNSKLPYLLVQGDAGAFSNLVRLKELVIEGSSLRSVPKLDRGDLKYLRVMSLADNKILDVNQNDLKGLSALQWFDLSRNYLTHLTEKSFPFLPNLQVIDLRRNPIETIYPFSFSKFNNTRSLFIGAWDLSAEHIGTPIQIFPETFSGLLNLQELWMGPVILDSQVDGLNDEYVKHLPSLSELHIRGQLNSIAADAFVGNPRLQVLDLQRCRIQRLSIDAFQGLRKLRVLDLSANDLKELLSGLFDPLISLRELWLNGNQLTTLPPSTFAQVGAKLIRLENNPWHCTCHLDQLNPTAVNKIRHAADGISSNRTVYSYDKKVAPLCSTPHSYADQSVFEVLRRVLKCKKHRMTSKRVPAHNGSPADDLMIEEHGPEVHESDDVTPEDRATEEQVHENADQDYIDHGPEIIEESTSAPVTREATTVQPPSTAAKSKHVNDVILSAPETSQVNFKRPFYSPTLSKKSLKLLQEEEKLKSKQLMAAKFNKTKEIV